MMREGLSAGLAAAVDHTGRSKIRRGESTQEDGRIPHMRPRPGRRRRSFQFWVGNIPTLLATILLLYALCAPASAAAARRPVHAVRFEGADLVEDPQMGEVPEEILFDHRPSPVAPLYRRQDDHGGLSSTSSGKKASTTKENAASSSSVSTGSVISSPSPTSSDNASVDEGIQTAPTATNSPLPIPFDGGLGNNFTDSSCSNFMHSMITNKTFTNCLPFSALLQNSMSFFDASRSLVNINRTLKAACDVDFSSCSNLMSSLAISIRSPSTCSDDFNLQNPMVRQAYNSLLSYDVMFRASCLKATPESYNNGSYDYCFADAVTNTSSPTDSYVYYLPLGIPLPAGSQPTCSQCLQDTMRVFAGQATNKSQPISLTYLQAAQLVDRQCGPDFANTSMPAGSTAGGSASSSAAPGPARGGSALPTTVNWVALGVSIWTLYHILLDLS